jgi:HAD-superfamily hydrolase, subfamily IIB
MINEKKLIAIDLDGTLITDNKKIRLETKLYLRKLERLGNLVCITTGRPERTTIRFYNKLKLHSPLLSYNGNYIEIPNDPSFKPIANTLNQNDIRKIYKHLANKYIESAFCENLNTIFYDKRPCFDFTLNENNHSKNVEGPLDKTLNENPLIFVVHLTDLSEENRHYITSYVDKNFPHLIVEFWGQNDYGEVHVRGFNKGAQIKKLMNLYNIKESNVYTFGDSINDIDLVTTFTNGFAMKNSNKRLLAVAHKVTQYDNNHNGVVKTLKKHIL